METEPLRTRRKRHTLNDERRVLFTITTLGVGGAETQLVRLALELHRRGWTVAILSLTPIASNNNLRLLGDCGIDVTMLDLKRSTLASTALSAARVFRRFKPVASCSFLFHSNVISTLLSKLFRVNTCVISVRNESFGGGKLRLSIGRILFRFADVVVVNSERNANRLIEARILPSERTTVVHNSVLRAPKTTTTGRNMSDSPDFTFVAIGRLVPAKDFPTLIHAMEILGCGQLVIAGNGPEMTSLVSLTERLKLQDQVEFLGETDDVWNLLGKADAYVLSSLSEGTPNTLLEAMSAGLPVIATDVGGVAAVLENAVGMLVEPGNSMVLAAAMRQMMELSPEELATAGTQCQQKVFEKHSLDAVADRWELLIAGDREAQGPKRG